MRPATAPLFVVLCVACGALSGCALMPFGNDGVDHVTTGSISPAATPAPLPAAPTMPPAIVDALADSDWQAIRAKAASDLPAAANGAELDWSNLDTGNSGTLAPLSDPRPNGALSCRAFALTVSDVRGIRRYHGDACQSASDAWQLFNMTPDDKKLL